MNSIERHGRYAIPKILKDVCAEVSCFAKSNMRNILIVTCFLFIQTDSVMIGRSF